MFDINTTNRTHMSATLFPLSSLLLLRYPLAMASPNSKSGEGACHCGPLTLGAKNSAKEAWEAIAAMHVSSDCIKKATTQLLKQEYATLKFKDGESGEDFSLRLQSLISKLRSHGVINDEEEAVSKFLHSMPVKYI